MTKFVDDKYCSSVLSSAINEILVSQRMINAISCYYCSTILHGNHCNDPFLTNNSNYLTTFNFSYKACAVKNLIFFFD